MIPLLLSLQCQAAVESILLLANQILIILGLHPEIGTNLMVEIFTGNPYWSLRKMETDHCPKMISVFIFARQCQICILISICSLLFISKVWRPVCRYQPSTGMPRSLLSHQWTLINSLVRVLLQAPCLIKRPLNCPVLINSVSVPSLGNRYIPRKPLSNTRAWTHVDAI